MHVNRGKIKKLLPNKVNDVLIAIDISEFLTCQQDAVWVVFVAMLCN